MNTTDISSLCPYTGLRSFTEEESIYFKGRDTQIDQITAQLSERKFLMLTGASGDGKSSLIYAGLVPQARSGFFKARFTNWTVVDFRPERSPLHNLIHAIASTFGAESSTIETELGRGFSSLVDIYLNSEYYPDYSAGEIGLRDVDQKQQLRKASNLMIIVDQFEEFFTNPENNDGEVPNQRSQVVVNLMLETARIALERSLPIYVVFTMRSDYIGQCSAFRGLPEFIGYSQFFVPRLTRHELKQVIEEPALLNGNTISRRLTERLIYDLNEGIDQLPILQHALSQIWRMANNGGEEMDLIHYSMVGGLSADELPAVDKPRFNSWLDSLPENQRQHYTEAGLEKVIEIHARKLYDGAADHYATIEDAETLNTRTLKNCIAITFACLTRIDNGRAVRNRMSLKEISQVINQPDVTPAVLGKILEIFRLPDNSFIRPFVFGSDSGTSPDTVLDITHESLIRNWGMLKRWANQEYTFYATFEDLRKQVTRWKQHHKSKSYLIPIGPLTYFETWYDECKPNAAWIRRYIDKTGNAETDRQLSATMLEDIDTYLAQSARNVALSRLLIKYGAGKIAGIAALAAVAMLAIYFMFDIYRKKTSTVIERVQTEGRQLLHSDDVSDFNKASYLLGEERLKTGTATSLLDAIPMAERLTITYTIWRSLYASPLFHSSQFRTEIITYYDKQLRSDTFKTLSAQLALQARVSYSLMSSYENYFDQDQIKRTLVTDNAAALFPLIAEGFTLEPGGGAEISLLNQAIQLWLTFGNATTRQIDQLIETISPQDSASRFNVFYKRGFLEADGYRPLDFNGGYHTLATLYAAKGDIDKMLWAFEQQLSAEDYFTDRLFNTRSNVLGYLYQYGHRELVTRAIAWHVKHFPEIPAHQILVDLINRSGYISELERVNLGFRNETSELGSFSLNLCLGDRKQYELILADYQSAINQIPDVGEREFLLAMHYKRMGVYSERYHRERKLENKDNIAALFDKALSHFRNLSVVDQNVQVTYRFYYLFGTRTRTWTRRQLFVFPDLHGSWQAAPKHGDAFFLHLVRKNLLTEVYTTTSDLNLIPFWVITTRDRFRSATLSNEALQAALNLVTTHPAGRGIDLNIVKIELSLSYLHAGDTARGNAVARQIDVPLLEASRSRYAIMENTNFLNELMTLSAELAAVGQLSTAAQLTRGFPNPESKVIAYLHCVDAAKFRGRRDIAKIMLDSASHLAAAVDEPTIAPWFFYSDIFNMAASYVGDKKERAQAEEMLRSTPESLRFQVYSRRMIGIARRDDLYQGLNSLPGNFTESQDLAVRSVLLNIASELENAQDVSGLKEIMQAFYYAETYVFFFGFNG